MFVFAMHLMRHFPILFKHVSIIHSGSLYVCTGIFRMTLTLSCPMNLHNYPMDTQTCFVDFASCKRNWIIGDHSSGVHVCCLQTPIPLRISSTFGNRISRRYRSRQGCAKVCQASHWMTLVLPTVPVLQTPVKIAAVSQKLLAYSIYVLARCEQAAQF